MSDQTRTFEFLPRLVVDAFVLEQILPQFERRRYYSHMVAPVTLSSQALLSMELFAGLSPPGLELVQATARVRRLGKETRIFNQGDLADRAYTVVEGGVRISQTGSGGGQVIIRLIGPGETFGTIALFTDRQYPADAGCACRLDRGKLEQGRFAWPDEPASSDRDERDPHHRHAPQGRAGASSRAVNAAGRATGRPCRIAAGTSGRTQYCRWHNDRVSFAA